MDKSKNLLQDEVSLQLSDNSLHFHLNAMPSECQQCEASRSPHLFVTIPPPPPPS